MPDQLAVADHLAVEQLFARYSHAFDAQDAEAWLGLFTDDATFEIVGYRSWTGRDELQEFLHEQMGSRGMQHWVNNLVITADGCDAALVDSYGMNIYYHEDGSAYVRRTSVVHSRVVKTDGRWRFERRSATLR